MKSNEFGRSMVEMIGVLSIIGILTMAGASMVAKALHSRKISKTIDQIASVSTNVKLLFLHRRNYIELNMPTLLGKGTFPSEMIFRTKNGDSQDVVVNHALGQEMAVQQGNEGKDYVIGLALDDRDACIRILTSDFGAKRIKIKEKEYTGRLSVKDANEACAEQ